MRRSVLVVALLLIASPAHACLESCQFFSEREGVVDLYAFDDCAFPAVDGRFELREERLGQIIFDEDGLATLQMNGGHGGHFYVNRSGQMLKVLTYDNWADYYEEGLVRSLVRGKVAFFDHEFNEVIPPRYDWAWPFQDGRALVCNGCSTQPPDEHGHRPVTGGVWGYIDKTGEEVVPVIYDRDELWNMQ